MQSLIGMCKVQTCLALAPNIKPYSYILAYKIVGLQNGTLYMELHVYRRRGWDMPRTRLIEVACDD